MANVISFSADEALEHAGPLAELLMDAVESGASVGFLPPLGRSDALEYWQGVAAAMSKGSRILLVVMEDGMLQASVQIDLEKRANGNHRAEVMKLFVHRRARRRGLAKVLMAEAEAMAQRLGRTLLIMDTRQGGEAEKMCESLGYVRYGEVPGYARSGDGRLHTTVFFYRQLD